MEIIKYEESGFLPGIILNKETGQMEMTGKACPEDPIEFYQPLFDWISEYSKDPNEKTVFTFKLVYYNTATSKILMMILQKLEELSDNGNDVLVKWHYPEDDEDMEEAGEDYSEMVEIKFEMIPYEEED